MKRRTFVFAAVLAVAALVVIPGVWRWLVPRPTLATLLRDGVGAIEAKDHDRAVRLFDEVLKRDPANAWALAYRGELARDLGDAEGALKFWARVSDERPQPAAAARYFEALLALSRHEAPEAERLLVRSARLYPAYLQPREKLAELYHLQLRDADLKRELDAIHEQRRWSFRELIASLGTMGKTHPSASRTSELEKFVAADEHDIHSALALTECYLAVDRPDQAAGLLERVLQSNPNELRARGRLAELRIAMDDLSGGERLLDEPGADGDSPVELERARGACLAALGDWPAAAQAFERAVALDSDHQTTLYRYGLALERAGRRGEAVVTLKESRLKEELSLQSWRIENADPERTEFAAQVAVEIARLLMELGRDARAVDWLEQALAWRPDDASAQERYAIALDRAQQARSQSTPGEATGRPIRHESVARHEPQAARRSAIPRAAVTAVAGAVPVLRLVDRHDEAGVEFQYDNGATGSKFLLETLGGGVAAFDFDRDGWPDLYFTQGRPLPVTSAASDLRDRLFRNVEGAFCDVTANAGLGDSEYSQGCSAGDFDNDGFVDLAVANFGANVLYQNNGDGTFSDVTAKAGLSGEKWHSSLAFADLDRDGCLDLYVVTYVRDPYRVCRPAPDRVITCSPLNFEAEQDRLYRSRGDGTFEDVSAAAGILAPDGKGLGIVVADLDNDGWPDIYVANDGTPNFLFKNETGAPGAPLRFQERGLVSGAAVSGAGTSQAGMGIACADLDGDGLLDLYVTNFYNESGTLYHNQGELLFVDATRAARLLEPTRQFLGFGTQPVDVDLDGWPDLFIANGHIDDFSFRGEPWKMRPQLFYNLGSARFADASNQSGRYFDGEYLGRGVARLDWNRDGRPDLAVVHQDRPVALLSNETSQTGRRVVLDLHGVDSNRDAIGARIVMTVGGATRIHEIVGGDGFFASNERRVILGVGAASPAADRDEPARVESLEIRWPSGRIDRWSGLPLDARLILIESRPPAIAPIE